MYKFNLPHKETFTVASFKELTDSQRQNIAEVYINRCVVYNMTTEVEYILNKSWEDQEAPFSEEDKENFDYYGTITINGYEYQLSEEEKEEKWHFYYNLKNKAETILDRVNESEPDTEDEEVYSIWEDKQERAQALFDKYEEIECNLHDLECDEQPEVFQWFLCPDLCYHLKEHGEVVLNGDYWGRGCCGQSIILDYVIQKIAFDIMGEKV